MFELAAKKNKYRYLLITIAAVSVFIVSCRTVKNYPVGQPFVYETNIHLEGKYTTDDKKLLLDRLEQQLHDSVRPRWQRKVFINRVLDKPPVYDSLEAAQSRQYISALLNSLGYYRDSIRFTDSIVRVGDQQRVFIDFTVRPGQLFRFDSIWYDLLDSVPYLPEIDTLQQLTLASRGQSLLKKGEAFSVPMISAELDRLSDLYRNNGYLRFSKEQLIAVWDTIGRTLIQPAFTPEDLARQLEELQRRRENPTADVQIRLRPNPDTSRLKRYYIGRIKVYPDFNEDTAFYTPRSEVFPRSRLEFISYEGLFNSRRLIRFVSLRPDSLYRQSDYLRTLNKFNSLGAWRSVTINQLPRNGQDTVDFDILLTPAKKYSISTNFEVSRNQALLSEGDLLGLGVNLGLTNRNFARAANQATTNIRYGIELGNRIDSIQTEQFTLTHTIRFPRQIPASLPFLGNRRNRREDVRTSLSFSLGSVDRKDYFNVRSFNTSWGYEIPIKHMLLSVRIPNIEYNFLQKGPVLRELETKNQSYKYIFSDGLILSSIAGLTIPKSKGNVVNIQRYGFEWAGVLTGLVRNRFLDSNLYRFLKFDAEFTQTRRWNSRTSFAWRIMGGLGWELPSSHNRNDQYLPFFRQYYAGGPNSMRAWSIRKLGPGSSNKSFDKSEAPDRFGDIRLEFNGEIRRHLTELFGFPLETALFVDMGNVWFLRENPDFTDGEFELGRLWKDIAIGVGTGLRWDFDFLKVRIDAAYKAKDPSTADVAGENVWFYKWRPWFGDKDGRRGAQLQLGINYPF